ncbi:hypothetical protein Y032_0163g3459 [Ancylostoma ceylanicum]|uniref:Uncharacterized protein n=1 Tax=Ancylostoma ceylanicum TaxID=53326 RepID=A0A016SXA7_9BILA|nr:hypothetical protein Y032_0163g3459 [Ancylostoma ceylanicum]
MYLIDKLPPKNTSEERDLRILLHTSLCFSSQCHDFGSRDERRLNQLLKASLAKDPIVTMKEYKILVRSLFEYGAVVFSSHKKEDIARLAHVLNSSTRNLFIRALGYTYNATLRGVIRNKMLNLGSLLARRCGADLILPYSELFAHGGPTVHPRLGVGWPPRACVNPPRE